MEKLTFVPRELPYELNEQYKYLRTNILLSGTDKKVILMTSSIPGEGKSTTTLELARSMAEIGKHVLLVDADLRRSSLKHKFTEPGKVTYGLSHFLSGMATLEDVLFATEDRNLHVIFAGVVPPNPAELLAAQRMSPLLQWARDKFDYIFVDAAPLTAVIDAAVIAPSCDASVFVVEADTIPYKTAQRVVQQLRKTGKPILGVVLNKIGAGRSKRYYKKYSYYKYRSEYRYTKGY